MKKMATKLITISSQILVVTMFLVLLFSGENTKNTEVAIINNNNFNKMADLTLILFEKEEKMIDVKSDDVVTILEDNSIKEQDIEEKVETKEPEPVKEEEIKLDNDFSDKIVIQTVVGNLTGYGADCYGCSGKTSSGFDLRNTMYYEDSEYGNVRILAADPSFPLYSIFRVSNVPGMDTFIAIVLDRGGNVGYGKGTLFDLAYITEKDPSIIGLTQNVTFELLRSGS